MQPIGAGLDPAETLARRMEPGLDGIAVRVGAADIFLRPSQMLSLEPQCPEGDELTFRCDRLIECILALKQGVGIAIESQPADAAPQHSDVDPAAISFLRYRTVHFWQPDSAARPVELIAGMRLLAPGEITSARIDDIIARTARHIVSRQRHDGFFAYEYLPGRDRYNEEDPNWVRQAGTIWAIARCARLSGNAEATACAQRAIAAMSAMARPTLADNRAQYIRTPDNRAKLGTTALFGLALLDAPDAQNYLALASALGDGIRTLQQPGGGFVTAFEPEADNPSSPNYGPGEALLCLARLYNTTRDPRWRDTMDKALPFYTEFYRTAAEPAFVTWHMQAYGQLARTTTLRKYATFVFDMADRISARQITQKDPPLAIYDGGIDVDGNGRSGISTAPYVEGLVEALATARAFKDAKRARRYEDVIRRASRFIAQLQIKPEETYYMRSPADAVDAYRSSPVDARARIDHAQHALSALLGARDLLFAPKKKK